VLAGLQARPRGDGLVLGLQDAAKFV
jgi:hypothetical protein